LRSLLWFWGTLPSPPAEAKNNFRIRSRHFIPVEDCPMLKGNRIPRSDLSHGKEAIFSLQRLV
jgi:hypothetical protein